MINRHHGEARGPLQPVHIARPATAAHTATVPTTSTTLPTAPQTQPNDRRAVLSSVSRVAIMNAVRAATHPVPVAEVADAVGLHANTARWHLDQLVETGWIERLAEAQGRRGRPRWLYRAAPVLANFPGAGDEPRGYGVLAEILADYLASTWADPAAAGADAGRAWGTHMVDAASASTPVDAVEATRRVAILLAKLGFSPSIKGSDGTDNVQRIILRTCPFRDVVATHPDVACSVHLGLMQGALTALGMPAAAATLRPQYTPGGCLATIDQAAALAPQRIGAHAGRSGGGADH